MGKKNKLTDLHDHLFIALERLNDEDLTGENLKFEMDRSRAITNVAKSIVDNAGLMLRAKKYFDENGLNSNEQPDILKIEDKSNGKFSN